MNNQLHGFETVAEQDDMVNMWLRKLFDLKTRNKERRKNKSPTTLFKDRVLSDINLSLIPNFQRFCHLTIEPKFGGTNPLTHGPFGYTNPITAKRQKDACHHMSF